MTKQNINDVNSIKTTTTGNMIAHNISMNLDKIETIKKRIIFPQSDHDYKTATIELNNALLDNHCKYHFLYWPILHLKK